MVKSLVQEGHVIQAFSVRDLAGSDNIGDWVSLKRYNHCSVIVQTADDVGGADAVISLRQAKTAVGGDAKPLNFTDVWHAGDHLLVGSPDFTRHQFAPIDLFQEAGSGEDQTITIIEVDAASLDVSNGFVYLQVKVDDAVSGPQLGSALYILSGPRYTDEFDPTV